MSSSSNHPFSGAFAVEFWRCNSVFALVLLNCMRFNLTFTSFTVLFEMKTK